MPEPGKPTNEGLRRDLRKHRDAWDKLRKQNRWMNYAFLVITIGLSTAITILSFLDQAMLSGILAIILTGLLLAQRALPYSAREDFYRVGVARADALEIELRKTDTLEEFELMVDSVANLVRCMADPPKGVDVSDQL